MDVFTIAPAASRSLWLIVLVPGLILVLVMGVLGAAVMSARSARFEVSPEGLRIRGDIFGRLIPAEQIRAEEARRVNFTVTPGLAPRRRTMGTGLPGYRAGWFRLWNGERALLYLTDFSRAVHVPTTDGYSLLLSPADPDAFLSALRGPGRAQ
jgi:hypothetical protein